MAKSMLIVANAISIYTYSKVTEFSLHPNHIATNIFLID